MYGDSVCSWGRVPGETSRRGAVRLRLKMSSPCVNKEVWVSSPGERGDTVGLLESEGEERGPQPDGDLGSRFVKGRAITEVRGAGETLLECSGEGPLFSCASWEAAEMGASSSVWCLAVAWFLHCDGKLCYQPWGWEACERRGFLK